MKLDTIAVHAGHEVDAATGAVAPAIHPSTTFERAPDGAYPRGHLYSRNSNPNRVALEASLAALEGGAAAAAFASGSAATSAVFQALAPGDHVVAPTDAYHGTLRLLRETFARWGLATTFVDMTEPGRVAEAVRPATKLVWVETPSNPLWKVVDLEAVAGIARRAGALLVCDNTTATPVLQSPFRHGADLVLHAATKYLNGHGDVMGGAVVAREPDGLFERVRAVQASGGAVPSPFDCWLTLRGIRTLHPGHAVAARQMSGFGGMLSFEVRGGREAAMAVAARVRLVTRATSFGGTESLIEHRASIEGPESRTPEGLLRLSVGLEHPDDLIADLDQALTPGEGRP
ncbi:MAG: aminotransferase class V-fold PLP-dependent enzyme [Candidatus Rokubacteria bacterium]|nr:aminotransferase class V-fold PLP-dependent enzyme [Candidatus Rokubacteria bacterium]